MTPTYSASRFYLSIIIIISALLGIPYCSNAQLWENEILKKTSIYQSIHHQEKIFVQTDRPIYVSGEEIWFSAFVINASTHLLNQTERVLYIELITPKGTSCQKQLFKIENGRAFGCISINEGLNAGSYHLIAYTNWMRNRGSDFCFSKQIYISPAKKTAIGDTLLAPSFEKESHSDRMDNSPAPPKLTASFFPEGGDLIQNISCKVAFEFVDEYSNSVPFSGLVVNGDGQVVTAAKTLWKGKGIFILTPQPGQDYYIQTDELNDNSQRYKLPDAKPAGLAMAIIDRPKQQQIQISVSQNNDLNENHSVFLLGTQNGLPEKAFKIDLSNTPTTSIQINKSDFNSGIVQFTLFDAHKIPQAERLFFIKNKDQLSIKIEEKVLPNAPKGKVELSLDVSDQQGKPIAGDFALSVTDAIRVPDAAFHSPNIFQYLTLYADLPLSKDDDQILFEKSGEGNFKSELLMLTNGWRRYQWEEVLTDTIVLPQYLEEPGIYVKGTVKTASKRKKIPADTEVSMMTKGKKMELFSEKVGKDGAFTFLLQDFEDTLRAVVQTKNRMNNKKDYTLELYTNYQRTPADNFRKLIVENNRHNDFSSAETDEWNIEQGVLTKSQTRAMIEDTFVVTTDFVIGEVAIEGERTKSQKEKISQKYGSPDYSVGNKRIQELAEEKPWHYGLMTLLSNAFPDLRIETSQSTLTYKSGSNSQGSNIVPSDSPSITFQLINKRKHRFFIFVDGQLITASDAKGIVDSVFGSYTIEDLISLNPSLVSSLDLIYPKNNTAQSALNSAAEIYEYEMSSYTTNNEVQMGRDLMDLAEQSEKTSAPAAILSIYTKDGAGLYSSTHYKGIANLTLHGFTKTKEFYHPNYSKNNNDSILNDFRNTLAWMPNLHTDSTGKANISFYTSDVSNTFRVEVNGLSNQGAAGAFIYKMSTPLFENNPLNEVISGDQPDQSFDSPFFPHIVLADGLGAAYATIRCPATKWRAYTSPDGTFSIDEKQLNDTTKIEISKPGYQTATLSYADISSKSTLLYPQIELPSDLSVEEIIKNFYRKKFKNRNKDNNYMEGAYREQLFNGNELHQLSDFYFIQKWQALTEPNARIETHLYSGRSFRSNDFNEKIPFKPKNRSNDAVPVMDPFFANLSFLNQAFAKNYVFTISGETYFMGRKMYHIFFNQSENAPWALYEGELYIDVETFGLAWARWRISSEGEKYLMPDEYLALGGDPETFKLIDEHNEITWKYNGEFWIPEFAISKVSFSQKGAENRIVKEMAWRSPVRKLTKFTSLLPEEMHRRIKQLKNPEYSPSDWRISWLLPPCKEITNQIKFLNNVVFYN